jgi:predicted oxidoreductase
MVKYFSQDGFSYLGVLFLMVAISVSLAVVTQNEDTLIKREKEQDWLFIGKQYQRAIASYYHQSPGGIKTFPTKVEDLLFDKRFIVPVRHLRKIYGDPLENQEAWVLIKDQNNYITGVYSRSQEPILNTRIISEYLENLGDQPALYVNIKFMFKPENASNTGTLNTTLDGNLTEKSDIN